MNIPKQLEQYFCYMKVGKKKTLSDEKTRLYICAVHPIYCVKVDGGIVPNIGEGIQKCDYLIYDEGNRHVYLIELKGEEIERAFRQIEDTIEQIRNNDEIKFLLEALNVLEAFIVSPGRRKVPKDLDKRMLKLARKLALRCHPNFRAENIMELIHFVIVVPKCNMLIHKKQTHEWICSGTAPMQL